jgi:hypothetical protein
MVQCRSSKSLPPILPGLGFVMSRPAPATQSKTKVTLWQHGNTLVIEPPVPEMLPAFWTLKHEPRRNAWSIQMAAKPVPLLLCRDDAMYCPAGLGGHVREWLEQQRVPVLDLGRGTNSELKPLGTARSLEGIWPEPIDDAFLELVAPSEQALIRYDESRVEPGRLIAQVAQAWPAAQIVCAMTRVHECHRLKQLLARSIRNESILVVNDESHSDIRSRIVIGTFHHLGGSEASLHNRDIIFCLNPIEMLNNEFGCYTIRNADRARVFGFLPADLKLATFDRDYCWATFGAAELMIPAHGLVQRPVKVLFLRMRGGPSLQVARGLLPLLQNGIWNHDLRNRRIARLAGGLATGDAEKVRSVAGDSVMPALHSECGTNPRVAILAVNVEQAIELCQRLSGWKLLTGKPVRINGLNDAQRKVLFKARQQPDATATGIVVTWAGLPKLAASDVLIRADGGANGLPAGWAIQNTINGVVCEAAAAVIIDFLDLHHPALRQRSRQRQEAYLDAGYRLPTEFASETDQFIATRPWRRLPK